MRQMRNIRTGKIAVYDADLVESGRWELIEPTKASAPSKPSKPFDQEFLNTSETVQISLTSESGELTELQV